MRKPPLFALGMCAAALLGQVSFTRADQAQTSGQQSPAQQNPQTRQASGQKAQAAPPSPQTAKKPSGQKAPAAPSPQTEKQTSSPKTQSLQSPQTGNQASSQRAQTPRPPPIPAGYRLLSLNEGRAIVQGMAWTDDEEGLSPDCSHLVHRLYQQAGYSYPYASSLDLYRGTQPFLRVRYAHPGDLVVWRGHVGIVVSPREHSFFSTTSSGTRLQNYRSAYWRARGYPHFFRYLTKTPLKAANNSGTAEAENHQSHH